VLAKVSAAELKLKQKLSEQRVKELAKSLDLRTKAAQKIINKIAAMKVGLGVFVNRDDFATLPDMVRVQLVHLSEKLEAIHDECTKIAQGSDDGDIITMQDTTHT
jgi:hypothetical protein